MPLFWTFSFFFQFADLVSCSFTRLYLEFVYTYSCLFALFLFLPVGLISVFHIKRLRRSLVILDIRSWIRLKADRKFCKHEGMPALNFTLGRSGWALLGKTYCHCLWAFSSGLVRLSREESHDGWPWGEGLRPELLWWSLFIMSMVYFILVFSPFLSRDCLQVNTCPFKKCVVALWCGVGGWIWGTNFLKQLSQ